MNSYTPFLKILLPVITIFISSSVFSLTTIQINQQLAKISNDLNLNLPRMIDSEIRLVSTGTLNKLLMYRGELVNYTADQISASAVRKYMTSRLVNTFCTSPEFEIFRSNDIHLLFIYFGKKSKHIVSINVSKKQCK